MFCSSSVPWLVWNVHRLGESPTREVLAQKWQVLCRAAVRLKYMKDLALKRLNTTLRVGCSLRPNTDRSSTKAAVCLDKGETIENQCPATPLLVKSVMACLNSAMASSERQVLSRGMSLPVVGRLL